MSHLCIHIGEERCKCEVCNKSYSQQSVFKIYQRIYIGECPYTWKVCNKACVQWSIFVKQLNHFSEFLFACDMCNMSFILVSFGNTYTCVVVSAYN
jgi:KRAB domain-containing zinc finger protein